ncbi:MAG: hypothetical protein WDM81_08600 [Rhizomicrobium sp.]
MPNPNTTRDVAAETALEEAVAAEAYEPAFAIDPAAPERFVNRELSWLAFNRRVLEEARNRRHPLLERPALPVDLRLQPRRVLHGPRCGLKDMVKEGVATQSADGLTPAQQLAQVDEMAKALIADQQLVWRPICTELREAGIAVIEADELTDADRVWLDAHFREQIFPC